MNIGAAAKASGISAKMIRHYEKLGLIPEAIRTAAAYRSYTERDVHMLRFIRRARDLGFPIKTIADLLNLWRDHSRRSAEVRQLAQEHLEELHHKIRELQGMAAALETLVAACSGDHRPDCPILSDLERSNRKTSRNAASHTAPGTLDGLRKT